MKRVCTDIEQNITDNCLTGICDAPHQILVGDVMDAISRLKPQKSDSVDDITSYILINGCDELFVH